MCVCAFTMGHVVDAIQVPLSFLIVHVLASGSHNLDGIMAEENLTRRPAIQPIILITVASNINNGMLCV